MHQSVSENYSTLRIAFAFMISLFAKVPKKCLPPHGTSLHMAQYIKAALVKDTSSVILGTVDNLYVTLLI